MTSTLIIDPMFNTPGMHDDTGAFEPHAQKLARVLGAEATRLSFDNFLSKALRLDELIHKMGKREETSLIHIGHGWHSGCEAGLLVGDQARLLRFFNLMPKLTKAVFLSCSTAGVPLKSSLAWDISQRTDVELIAHTTEGRDAQNPNVVHIARGGFRSLPDWRGKRSPYWKEWVNFLLHREGWVDMTKAFLGLDTTNTDWRFFTDADAFLQWEPREEDITPVSP